MQLERRFDWSDTKTVYLRPNEQTDFEPAKMGMVSFTVTSTDNRVFRGKCYQTSGSAMVDTPTGYFKLEAGEKWNNIIPCTEKGTKLSKKGGS